MPVYLKKGFAVIAGLVCNAKGVVRKPASQTLCRIAPRSSERREAKIVYSVLILSRFHCR